MSKCLGDRLEHPISVYQIWTPSQAETNKMYKRKYEMKLILTDETIQKMSAGVCCVFAFNFTMHFFGKTKLLKIKLFIIFPLS